jgi:hypothetical protein
VFSDGTVVETVRDHFQREKFRLAVFDGQSAVVMDQFVHDGELIVPGEITPSVAPYLQLPHGVRPCGQPGDLVEEIVATLWRYVDLPRDELRVVAAFALASWFPDGNCVAPYLWLCGPLGSGKTVLLKLLHALCHRAFLIGDLTPAALYRLPHMLRPTLLIDENDTDNSRMSLAVQRLLRIGNVRGTPAIRNGNAFDTFCPKVIASREFPSDAALASRAILIGIAPAIRAVEFLDDTAIEQIAVEFQDKLLQFRMRAFNQLGVSQTFYSAATALAPRMRDLAHALATPLLGDVELEKELIEALEWKDSEARVHRSLEPEWLVAQVLFRLCHPDHGLGNPLTGRLAAATVGAISIEINEMMARRGEDQRLQARRVGAIMRTLGVRTKSLGNLGRGIELTPDVREQIHGLAQRMGITRKDLLNLFGGEPEFGGAPCKACEKFRLLAGLKFVAPAKPATVRPISSQSHRLL